MKAASSLVQFITLAACFTVYVAAAGETDERPIIAADVLLELPPVAAAGKPLQSIERVHAGHFTSAAKFNVIPATMDLDEKYLARAVGRMHVSMAVMSAAGVVSLLVWQGWRGGLGFALGAAASWLNFRWLKQIVDALGSSRPTRKRVAVLAGLRYALLGGGSYVILRYSLVSLTAAMVGLFVAVAAVIAEICFELVYARND